MNKKPIIAGAAVVVLAGGLVWLGRRQTPVRPSPAHSSTDGKWERSGVRPYQHEHDSKLVGTDWLPKPRKSVAQKGRSLRELRSARSLESTIGGKTSNLVEEISGPSAYSRLRELSEAASLNASDSEALYRFLRQKTTDEKLQRMASIKNSVMNILARQENLPWSPWLEGIYHDQDQHIVIRDYALQHLFTRYEVAIQGAAPVLNDARMSELLELFWAATDRKQQSIAGTALIGLFHLSGLEPKVDRERLAGKSVELLEAQHTGDLARISAFQVCGLLRETRALPQARAAAQNGGGVALRVAAIAALGALGNREDSVQLQAIGGEPNPSIRLAAAAAIQRIQSKPNG